MPCTLRLYTSRLHGWESSLLFSLQIQTFSTLLQALQPWVFGCFYTLRAMVGRMLACPQVAKVEADEG